MSKKRRSCRYSPTDRQGLLAANEPASWVDYLGTTWLTVKRRGRLKFQTKAAQALRAHITWRDFGICACCADDKPNNHAIDHVISRRNGGSNHPDNLQLLCHSCNASKTSVVDKKWLAA